MAIRTRRIRRRLTPRKSAYRSNVRKPSGSAVASSFNWYTQQKRQQSVDVEGYLIDEFGNFILDESGNKIFVGL